MTERAKLKLAYARRFNIERQTIRAKRRDQFAGSAWIRRCTDHLVIRRFFNDLG